MVQKSIKIVEKKIRVCNIDEEGRFGGPENRIVQIAKAINDSDEFIENYVIFPSYDSKRFAHKLSIAHVQNSPMNITRLSKERNILIRYIFRFIPEVILLFLFFRKEKFDLVQVNGSQQFKGAIASKLAGIPLIWLLEDAMMSSIVKRICTFLARFTASGIIVVGKKVYDYYIKGTSLEKKQIIEIHPPVNTILFDKKSVQLDENLEKFQGTKIVTVSGINPTKGLEYFIEMASELVMLYDNLYFFIAAPNFKSQEEYFKNLMGIIKSSNLTDDNLKFLGMIDNIPSFLKSGDIFVYTSISESGPMAVWEAMAMGKAIVTSDVGSVSNYLVDGESGFIVPPQNSDALIEKVDLLINDKALREQMSAKVRSIVTKRLDVSIAAKKYANFYRKILSIT